MADNLKWLPHTRPLGLITTELNKETNYPPFFCHIHSPRPPSTALCPAQTPLKITQVLSALCPSMDDPHQSQPRAWLVPLPPPHPAVPILQGAKRDLQAGSDAPASLVLNSPVRDSPPVWSRHHVGCAPRGAGGLRVSSLAEPSPLCSGDNSSTSG